MTKAIKWGDILIHCGLAFVAAGFAGYGLQIALATTGWQGIAAAVLVSCGALGGGWIWALREKLQHGGEFGGRQSMLEWIGPVVATPFGMAAGWWASKLLL